jgi:hypothetical protein
VVPNTAPIPGPLRLQGESGEEGRGAIVTNPATGNIYVIAHGGEVAPGESVPSVIDEFSSTGTFVNQFSGGGHITSLIESIAVSRLTDELYVASGAHVLVFSASSGDFVEQWSTTFGEDVHLAIDNSSNTSAGTVYVDAEENGVRAYTGIGAPAIFTATGSYILGNELTGTPSGPFGAFKSPWAMTTDSQGHLYVIWRKPLGTAVAEFDASGAFVREFTAAGLSTTVEAVAVDPTDEHLLVASSTAALVEGVSTRLGVLFEFDPSGRLLNTIDRTAADTPIGWMSGVATGAAGDVYIGDSPHGAVDLFSAGAFLPDVIVADVTEDTPTSVRLNGLANPEGVALTDCHFEYVTETEFELHGTGAFSTGGTAPCVPSAASIPADGAFHAVSATITGLTSAELYRYRLVAASNPAEQGGASQSLSVGFVAAHKPLIEGTASSELSSQYAELAAEINPMGSETGYRFQYVDAANYEATATEPYALGKTTPEVEIGAGDSNAKVQALAERLLPSTTYHFRAVATNAFGITTGPDGTFTTLAAPSLGLPDGRAYELVTPTDKGGAEDMLSSPQHENFDVGYSSNTGNEFLFYTGASFGSFPGSGEKSYVFSRQSKEWSTTSAASPSLGVQSIATEVYDLEDFSKIGIDDFVGSNGEREKATDVSLVGAPGGPYTTISSTLHRQASVSLMGASADVSHVVLETVDHELAPGAGNLDEGSTALYEWTSGQLGLVDVNNSGTLISRCGAILGGNGPGGVVGSSRNAVSGDGKRIIFTAPDPYASGFHCSDEGFQPQIYIREGGTQTIEASAPEAGVTDPTGSHPAVFVGASEDGDKIFFVTTAELTADDKGHALELYEYSAQAHEGKHLERVSRGELGNTIGNVAFVPAVSSDGSTVYFAAWGQLAAGAPPVPSEGELVNLYRYDAATGKTTYIATVSQRDYPDTNISKWYHFPNRGELGLDATANWFTNNDGKILVFGTTQDITGYDSDSAKGAVCPDLTGTQAPGSCSEVYRYDADTSAIACVSCDPNGAAPLSNAEFARSAVRADNPAGSPPRPVSENGEYVFFDTVDPLVPQDTNGALDVYEWHNGMLSLITTGSDAADSFFLDSDPSGANVFFGTHARLVRQDTDTAGDIYDARIGGGFESSAGTGPCEGDACANQVPPPLEVSPASFSFVGAGNVTSDVTPAPKTSKKSTTKGRVSRKKKNKKKTNKKQAGKKAAKHRSVFPKNPHAARRSGR